jgi:hypothetical protein
MDFMILLIFLVLFVVGVLLLVFFTNAILATIGAFFGLLSAAATNFESGAWVRGLLLLVPAGVIAYFVGPLLALPFEILWIWVKS